MTEPPHVWLDRVQAAAYLRISLRLLDDWVREKRVKSKKVGRRRLFRTDWLDQAILGHSSGGEDPK